MITITLTGMGEYCRSAVATAIQELLCEHATELESINLTVPNRISSRQAFDALKVLTSEVQITVEE